MDPLVPLALILGMMTAHFSVNALNDYMDYKSGLDFKTPRTPFSGGTKLLVDGLIKESKVLSVRVISILMVLIVGIYLAEVRDLW